MSGGGELLSEVGESITGLVVDESRDLLATGDAGGCIKVRALTALAPLTMPLLEYTDYTCYTASALAPLGLSGRG